MKRFLSILTLFLASCSLCCAAGNRTVGFDVEWGNTVAAFTIGHRNFNDPQKGFRRNETVRQWKYSNAGLISLGVYARIGQRNELGLRSGYRTIVNGRGMIPITVKYTRTFMDRGYDGWKIFVEAGPGFSMAQFRKIGGLCVLGGGYRLAQTGNFSIDASAALQMGIDHPQIILETGECVPEELTRHSTCGYAGITFSVSFNF